ncbi:PEBP-like protein [Exidia glandulosa HHB12029]|uniref:PEBP-like protein n=1 Tax=Exidia glandulosa HHB12029 TaxID=1314781 RepID=A0A165EQ94_EXIGL|nr:PEBP-like protein [Exidia glandulosa HHB12029]
MLALALTVALAATSLVRAQDNDTATVAAAFMNAGIVPDVLSSFAPVLPLLVTFKQADGSSIEVTAGMQLTIAQTANEPTFALVSGNAAIQGKPYLIAMVDPDAPTPQNTSISQVRHFLAPDFVSDGPVAGTWPMTNRTPALSEYMGPHPPDGSDAHRFVSPPLVHTMC